MSEQKPRKFWINPKNVHSDSWHVRGYGPNPSDDPDMSSKWIQVIEVLPKPKTKFFAYLYHNTMNENRYYVIHTKENTPPKNLHCETYTRVPHLDFEIEE